MKRIFLFVLILLTTAFATDYLVLLDLDKQRLDPIFEKGLTVIAELENSAILLVNDNEFDRLTGLSQMIIGQDPQPNEYYVVYYRNERIDLRDYGEVLFIDGPEHLLRIAPGMLEPLIREKVDVQRLTFKAFVRSDKQAPRFTYNPLVQGIVDQVDPDSILSYVQRLQDFVTRYSTHDSCFAAADYIANKFNAYGCDSVYFQYHTGGHAPNVIGVKRGTTYPDSIYSVVCGHFDATSYLAPDIAPGADDNASGTAGVIEAMRVMKDHQFEYSVRYIAFSGEEFGLYGSYYYASLANSQGDSILGVLNADMIAYVNSYPESVDVLAKISNPACEPFADFFIAAADSYTNLLTNKQMVNSAPYSDHHPFWQNGYLALCNIEDNPPVNPYYHEPGDTIGSGYNDNGFCTEVIKAQVAALSLMAGPLTAAYLTVPDYWIVDTAPGGNGNGFWESGEEVSLVIQVYNMGVDTAKNSCGLVSTTSSYVTMIDDSCYVGNILPQDTVEMIFTMSAAGSVPLGYQADFDLGLSCNSGTWDYAIQIYINPLPNLIYHGYSIIDANGILEPGETADLVVTVSNHGAAPAMSVTSTLVTYSPLITVNDNSGNFGAIPIGDTASNASDPFNVTASASAAYGTTVDCDLIVQAGMHVDTLDFLLAIGEPVPSDTGFYYSYYSGGLHTYAPTFDWFEIAPPGPGTIISEITDEDADTVTVTLPFTFKFYGTDYNSIGICSNGFMEMGSSTHRFGANTGIPSAGGPRAMIAPFWDDLDPSLYGDIYQYHDAANHRWIVEFYDVAHYGASGQRETFQVMLLDPLYYPTPTGDGEILVQYLNGMAQTEATFGIENYAEDVGIQYYYDGVYHEWAAEVTDSCALLYTTYPPDYVGIEESEQLVGVPVRTMLGMVYPNPFARELSISYQVARSGRVTLRVYDALGRAVCGLAQGIVEPGYYTVNWDGRDDVGRQVPAGVYFVKFAADNYQSIQKTVLLK